jgi:hypothetical protein
MRGVSESSLLLTLRWRDMDSNHRFRVLSRRGSVRHWRERFSFSDAPVMKALSLYREETRA